MKNSFENLVSLKYQVYNSVFLTLRFEKIRNTGILLPVFQEHCRKGFEDNKDPASIIRQFFDEHSEFVRKEDELPLLFRFIQYVERQIVLIDAIEDAAFPSLHNMKGEGSMSYLLDSMDADQEERLKDFALRIVLTAHPTQFYPGEVLGIITDLAKAIEQEKLLDIKLLLEQLGKTPFFKRKKPTPLEEAIRLGWYLENVFYDAIPAIIYRVVEFQKIKDPEFVPNYDLIRFGFWPGGDRDGNPYVNSETTLQVAERLKGSLLKCYHNDLRKLRRRLTFKGVFDEIQDLERRVYSFLYKREKVKELSLPAFIQSLEDVHASLVKDHNGLFKEEVEKLITKAGMFGFHFATIDIRQDSRVIDKAFQLLVMENQKSANNWESYFKLKLTTEDFSIDDLQLADTVEVFSTIRKIQAKNGEKGCHRFIISNCRGPESIGQVFALAKASGMMEPLKLDIIPLFETIQDLKIAGEALRELYSCAPYRKHLKSRNEKQVIMLGFSDGTKDGGYFAANWNIYRAKEEITKVSREFGISAIFFDGRGGPPARGGGETHKFYAAQGREIERKEIELTIQGQTISSKLGDKTAATFYVEQLVTAGLSKSKKEEVPTISEKHRVLISEISRRSLKAYLELKNRPEFIPYLQKVSPLSYFSQTNIASRPSKRGKSKDLNLEDLRAIPFVGAWSLLKQNVPGYFGFGTALQSLNSDGKGEEVQDLFEQCAWFRTLVSNSMQSLSKCVFPLTQYLAKDPEFGEFWNIIHDEYLRTKNILTKMSGMNKLMLLDPNISSSIQLREHEVLPLLTIQQFALIKMRDGNVSEDRAILEKLIIRSMYGIINAARNSA